MEDIVSILGWRIHRPSSSLLSYSVFLCPGWGLSQVWTYTNHTTYLVEGEVWYFSVKILLFLTADTINFITFNSSVTVIQIMLRTYVCLMDTCCLKNCSVHSRDDVIGKVSISKELLTAKPQGKREYFLESIYTLYSSLWWNGKSISRANKAFLSVNKIETARRVLQESCDK